MLPGLRAAVTPDDNAAAQAPLFGASFTEADFIPIPPFDLPFGVPGWLVQGGGHSARDGDKKIVWNAP